jgi:hypothetical protein
MNIVLEDLQRKTVRGSEGVTISDNNINLSKFTGSEVIFTGKYTKGLLITARPQIQVTFKDTVIDNAGTNATVKVDGVYDQFKLHAVNTKLFGKTGNAASQMIYFLGTWSNVQAGGFEIDHRRDSNPGKPTTVTGACVQFAGVLKASHNLKDVRLYDMIIRNAGDEGTYVNHFQLDGGYAKGENLLVENVSVFGAGRDFDQQWGFRNVTYRKCYGENGGLEADPERNHVSALSMNGDTETMLIQDCEFKNVGQLLYSGSGKGIKAVIENVRYSQGTHAGSRINQAAYLKGPGEYAFKNCIIDAPNVKEAAITADGAKVTYENCKITAPKISRVFNAGSVAEVASTPIVTKENVTAILQTTTLRSVVTKKLLYDGKEFPLE